MVSKEERNALPTATRGTGDRRRRAIGTAPDQPFQNGACASRRTREDAARLRGRGDGLGDRAVAEHEPAEGGPVRAQGAGVGRADGAGRPAAAGAPGDDHARGAGVAGVGGVPQADRAGLRRGAVDGAPAGRARAHALPGGRASGPGGPGAGHGVEDPRHPGGATAQDRVLPGATRPRVRREDGAGAVLLPGGGAGTGARRGAGRAALGVHLLRREARHPGRRHDGAGPSAGAGASTPASAATTSTCATARSP